MEKPYYRPRRLRRNEAIRSMVRETHLSPNDFIYPFFVCPGSSVRKEIGSMQAFSISRSTFLLRNLVLSGLLALLQFCFSGYLLPKTK
jgi:delta-aminolevulinic acid dehydratase/porphobilinogen synthase